MHNNRFPNQWRFGLGSPWYKIHRHRSPLPWFWWFHFRGRNFRGNYFRGRFGSFRIRVPSIGFNSAPNLHRLVQGLRPVWQWGPTLLPFADLSHRKPCNPTHRLRFGFRPLFYADRLHGRNHEPLHTIRGRPRFGKFPRVGFGSRFGKRSAKRFGWWTNSRFCGV